MATVGSHEHVGGLEVPVDDAPLVCGPEGLGDLDPEVEQAVGGQRLPAHEVPQRPAVEQLHHEERAVAMAADVVDRADVRVVEPCREPRLALEALLRGGLSARLADSTFRATARPSRRSSAR